MPLIDDQVSFLFLLRNSIMYSFVGGTASTVSSRAKSVSRTKKLGSLPDLDYTKTGIGRIIFALNISCDHL